MAGMAMGTRDGEQEDLFITHQQLRSQSHPYYQAVNKVLAEKGFDKYAEKSCAKFYAKKMGRPSMAPGVYFRCLLLGYFEGIDSERGIAWRAADSLSLRDFLGIPASKETPDHSTISRTRRLLDLETHQAVFSWVLGVLDSAGLIRGKTLGVDGTTLEANAAMKSIVRRDDGRSYEEFLAELAKTSGIATPTREDLARMDRKREKKGSNADWYNPHDPEAKISKMKDGSTHLAHKEEHAVDMDTGAVVAVTLDGGTAGDTTTLEGTLEAAKQNLEEAREHAGKDFEAHARAERGGGRQGLPQQDGDVGIAARGMAQLHRRASSWPTALGRRDRGAGRRLCQSSTEERQTRSASHAPSRRDHRADLRPCTGDWWHAKALPVPPGEHRQAVAGSHRRVQPRSTDAQMLRRRQTEVSPGPVGRPLGCLDHALEPAGFAHAAVRDRRPR